jgi:hypothetical protein
VFLRYQNYPFGLVLLHQCKTCFSTDEFAIQTGSARLRRESNSTSMLSTLKKEVLEEPDPLDDGHVRVVPYDLAIRTLTGQLGMAKAPWTSVEEDGGAPFWWYHEHCLDIGRPILPALA